MAPSLDRLAGVANLHSGIEHGIVGNIVQTFAYNFCKESLEEIELSAKQEVINEDFCMIYKCSLKYNKQVNTYITVLLNSVNWYC